MKTEQPNGTYFWSCLGSAQARRLQTGPFRSAHAPFPPNEKGGDKGKAASTVFQILTLILLIIGSPAMAETPRETLDRLFQEQATAEPRFAIAAAIAIGHDDPYVLVSGTQSIDSDIQVGVDASWHIGSITKSFTAALVFRLVERGVLDLDAAIGSYLGQHVNGMHEDWQALTLRQLLSHTGGIPANASLFNFSRGNPDDPTAARVVQLQRLWHRPTKPNDGSYEYSNIGYVLAGLVAETVTGQPWLTLIQGEIAKPLGLESLGFGPPKAADAPWGHASVLGRSIARSPRNANADNPDWMGPSGLLNLSMSDLARWGQAHQQACAGRRPDFLSAESCTVMRTPVAEDYGLGWIAQPHPGSGSLTIFRNGSNSRWYAILAMVPDENLVMAIATNHYDANSIDAFMIELINTIVDDP